MNAPSRTASNASRSSKPNKASKLLTHDENEQVFALVGPKRQVNKFEVHIPMHTYDLELPLYLESMYGSRSSIYDRATSTLALG